MQNSGNFLIYLASASPRRSALLRQIGVAHRVQPVDVDERLLAGETPVRYVERLATLKADVLWGKLPEAQRAPVLGADTTVVIDGQVLAKPDDEADGLRMLRLLSGRTHQVCTAAALRDASGARTRISVSEVRLRAVSEEECRAYWRSGEPADKAGGYAVQGLAAAFIEHIAGSYSGIMGLPLFETAELLRSIGWRIYSGAPRAAEDRA